MGLHIGTLKEFAEESLRIAKVVSIGIGHVEV